MINGAAQDPARRDINHSWYCCTLMMMLYLLAVVLPCNYCTQSDGTTILDVQSITAAMLALFWRLNTDLELSSNVCVIGPVSRPVGIGRVFSAIRAHRTRGGTLVTSYCIVTGSWWYWWWGLVAVGLFYLCRYLLTHIPVAIILY
jgi:hypothetical protein